LKSIAKLASPLWELTLDLIFPAVCQGCSLEGTYLCLNCQGKLKAPLERCLVCGKNSLLGLTHPECRSRDVALTGLMVAADYHAESIRKLIWHLKYNSVFDIAASFGTLMTDYLTSRDLLEYFGGAAVVPVPLHEKRLRTRGFNQAEAIAKRFAENLRLDYLPILHRVKNTASQVDLPREERLQNIADAFIAEIRPSLGERKILLIDDVATTGATLNECAKVLRHQEVGEVWGLVVARN
jgi:ComF family protein